ncbi:MAG TPA: hypothetical protein VJ821_04115 [Anaerolineales bacterium]|nr:hypothetical protein [Anaerolineales bacterium]
MSINRPGLLLGVYSIRLTFFKIVHFRGASAMKIRPNEQRDISGPKDKTFAAYKVWVEEIVKRLTTENTKIELSEQEWEFYWKEYWKEQFNK